MRKASMLIGSVGLAAVSSSAAATDQAVPQAEILAIEAQLGKQLPLPGRIKSVATFDRHYWRSPDGQSVQAQFIATGIGNPAGVRKGKVSTSSAASYSPMMDGGCFVVNLVYFDPNDPRNRITCGGR